MSIITVTGIDTEVGKTVTSAILMQALDADYWKPVQTGAEEGRDTETVQNLVDSPHSQYYPEAYCLNIPASPHYCAHVQGIDLSHHISPPETTRPLVIEGAGGALCPFNHTHLMVDVLSQWPSLWVIVCKHRLGSINHSLMTVEALRKRNLPILGFVFNGEDKSNSEQYITAYTKLPVIGRISTETTIDRSIITGYANSWKEALVARLSARI